MEDLGGVIEAILFVSGEPVEAETLAHALNLTTTELNLELDKLSAALTLDCRGIQLNRNGGSLQLSINPKFAPQVEAFLQPVRRQSLSQSVMETLSVIAYRQPVTRGEIEAVRGVKCDYSVQSLLNKGFIAECGQRDTLGHPMEYRTTDAFLQHFGLSALTDLPAMEGDSAEALPST